MRIILDIFGQFLRTLWAYKLRSFLTMFGVAWGPQRERLTFDTKGETIMLFSPLLALIHPSS